MIIEDLRCRVISDRQIIAMCITSGGKNLEIPDVDKEIKAFDDWLSSSPDGESEMSENATLLKALGLKK